MSIKLMTWVWDNSPYQNDSLLIHLALADWANDEGICWPKQTAIATKARCSVEHVRRVTKRMQEDGYLEIISTSKGPGSAHKYQLKNPTYRGASEENPTTDSKKAPQPVPNNRQEPPVSSNVRVACPYCNRKFTWGTPHNCSAMNQRL